MRELLELGVSTRELKRIQNRPDTGSLGSSVLKLSSFQQAARQDFLDAIQEKVLNEQMVDCPVCGCSEGDYFCGIDRIGIPVETVYCRRCPTLYSRSRLDGLSLEKFYSIYYRSMYTGMKEPTEDWFFQQVASGRKILQQLTELGGLEVDLQDAAVLEVGCGAGGILVPFKEAGATVVGIDFDETYMEKGRSHGLLLQRLTVHELAEDMKFDLIILKDVLEHLEDVHAVIESLKDHLTESGRIYIQVPCFEALEFLGYRSDFLRYFQSAHVVHFSEVGLKYVFMQHGLHPVHSDTTGLAIFRHVRDTDNAKFDLSRERLRSLKTIVETMNNRRKISLKESMWGLLPQPAKRIYKLLRH